MHLDQLVLNYSGGIDLLDPLQNAIIVDFEQNDITTLKARLTNSNVSLSLVSNVLLI